MKVKKYYCTYCNCESIPKWLEYGGAQIPICDSCGEVMDEILTCACCGKKIPESDANELWFNVLCDSCFERFRADFRTRLKDMCISVSEAYHITPQEVVDECSNIVFEDDIF